MSMIRPIARLAALIAVLVLTSTASAQRYQPFIDPGTFEPDFQLFAPAEVSDFDGGEPANTGFYFDWDKLYVAVTRPDGAASNNTPFNSDFTWGNRWELGYMTEEDTGWQAIITHISGPNVYESFFQERIDRYNDDDDGTTPVNPVSDRNPRYYQLKDSVNVSTFSSCELNKTWRRKEFHNGTILEPLLGFRAMNFRNVIRRDTYSRYEADAAGQPDPGSPNVEGVYEELVSRFDTYQNHMVGGQLGTRLFHQRGHWMLSGEVRFFGCANFQHFTTQTDDTITRYGGLDTSPPELIISNSTWVHNNANVFVWGGEVRAEASYELTREVNLRFGFEFLDLGQGIGRSNNIQNNDEDVQMYGLTFGFTVNR